MRTVMVLAALSGVAAGAASAGERRNVRSYAACAFLAQEEHKIATVITRMRDTGDRRLAAPLADGARRHVHEASSGTIQYVVTPGNDIFISGATLRQDYLHKSGLDQARLGRMLGLTPPLPSSIAIDCGTTRMTVTNGGGRSHTRGVGTIKVESWIELPRAPARSM